VNTKNFSGMSCFGLGIYFIILIVGGILMGGWVISILWNWFIVPLGLPAISLAHSIGLSLMVNVFKGYTESKTNEEEMGTLLI